jgi:hypothetical protein
MGKIGLAIALAIVMTANLAFAEGPAIGQVSAIKGEVFRERPAGRESVAVGTPVYVADAIVTAVGGKAKIALNDGSILSVGESGRLVIAGYQGTDNGYTTRVQPAAGAIRLFVNKTVAGGRFEVETESAVAAVRGTDFVVEVTPERTSVAVLQGIVAVHGTGAQRAAEVVLDKPGDGTDVAPGQAPTATKTWGAARLAATVKRASFDD